MSGAMLWMADYDAFGKADISRQSIVNNLRFPGQYHDTETGLHYNYFRYFDSEIGRYITADPVGVMAGWNLYVYGLDNPIMNTDQQGLITPAGWGLGVACLGLAAAEAAKGSSGQV